MGKTDVPEWIFEEQVKSKENEVSNLMEYKKLGKTGLEVSVTYLGCMTYGVPERGPHPWTLNEEQSRPLIRQALESGINFFDTANGYSDGTSEEIVGRALLDFARRDEVVIATKVFAPMHKGANAGGLSRKAIMTAVDASLKRLGTDSASRGIYQTGGPALYPDRPAFLIHPLSLRWSESTSNCVGASQPRTASAHARSQHLSE